MRRSITNRAVQTKISAKTYDIGGISKKKGARLSGIHGDNILYHYIQKKILIREDEFAYRLLKRLIVDLSIWLPTNLYCRIPIMLPFVVRDPSCRKRKAGEEEEWGSADEKGFFRDDNTLIKGIVRGFEVCSPKIREYHGRRLGRGFVSSHIWRDIKIGGDKLISNRHYKLNSFIPNVVWLPRQVAKFTDREGSIAQRMLQIMAYRIYHDTPMPKDISKLWGYLPIPYGFEDLEIERKNLNFFVVEDGWIKRRVEKMLEEIAIIVRVVENQVTSPKKVKCSRYLSSLASTAGLSQRSLVKWLKVYRGLIRSLGS